MEFRKNYFKYRAKYFKYKIKYLNILMGGSLYNNLRYIDEGAETIIYELGDIENQVIKISKNPQQYPIEETEKNFIRYLMNNPQKYFPKYYSFGKCYNSTEPSDKINAFCDSEFPEHTEYTYIIMEKIKGVDIVMKFLMVFKDDVRTGIINMGKINIFVDNFINIVEKIVQGINDINQDVTFRHGDLDFRNCLITDDYEPVIIDFGQSEFIQIPRRSQTNICKDIRAFVMSALNYTYYNKKIDKLKKLKELPSNFNNESYKKIYDAFSLHVKIQHLKNYLNPILQFPNATLNDIQREINIIKRIPHPHPF